MTSMNPWRRLQARTPSVFLDDFRFQSKAYGKWLTATKGGKKGEAFKHDSQEANTTRLASGAHEGGHRDISLGPLSDRGAKGHEERKQASRKARQSITITPRKNGEIQKALRSAR